MTRQSTNQTTIAPGEGERRAVRGYVPQYELSARLIFESMASGTLRWVGLADRSAGDFDDLVLGLQDRVVGYQVKSRRDPEAFSLQTLLLGSENLLQSLVSSWKRLTIEHKDTPVQIAYVTDDFPRPNDTIGDTAGESSAAYLRTHDAHAAKWSQEEWAMSPFWSFLQQLVEASGLSHEEFFRFWRNVRFQTGGIGRRAGFTPSTVYDERRLKELFGLLPTLVADKSDADRWTVEQILERLKWRDPFKQRHEHVFPIDSLVQANRETETALQLALDQIPSGYVSIVGPPGSGKSTLLQSGLLPTSRSIIMRYLAFVPDEGHGLGRAEAIDFLHDLIGQFKRQGLGHNVVLGSELPELRQQFEQLLSSAADRFSERGIRTIVVVDGLDHVPREERPERSLLCELPLPSAVPNGVIFILGTQRLDLNDIPPAVRDQAGANGRRIDMAALSREAVHRLADAAQVPSDVERNEIWERSEGHPLSVRYLVEGLLRCGSAAARRVWLREAPADGRNVNAFYERAWHDLENQELAQEALAYIALGEGAVDPPRLDEIVGSLATDAAWNAAAHLLRWDKFGRWSIFHNSFRLFLIERTSQRFGRYDADAVGRRYRALAEMSKRASDSDPQRWLELRYRAKAGDYAAVSELATPSRFRAQLADGRNPDEIQADIRFGFAAARELRSPEKLFELILCRNEIEMRSDALGVEALVDAYIAVDQIDAAIDLIASDATIPIAAKYRVVDALLQQGSMEEAKRLFQSLEPVGKILGAEGLDLFVSGDQDLYSWARRVLIFRELKYFQGGLSNLRLSERRSAVDSESLTELRRALRMLAARAEIESNADCDLQALARKFEIEPALLPRLEMTAASIGYEENLDEVARRHLTALSPHIAVFDDIRRRRAAHMLLVLGDRQLAARFFDELSPPNLNREPADDSDWIENHGREILLHASIETQLNGTLTARSYSSNTFLAGLQHQLETLGRLAGEARAGRKLGPDEYWIQVRPLVTLLQRGEGKQSFERWEFDHAVPEICNAIISVAALNGHEVAIHTIERIDDFLAADPGYLGYPRFRRSFAHAAFAQERDMAKAIARLNETIPSGAENTPYEYVDEIAKTAEALAEVGGKTEAQRLLRLMYEGTLGVSRPARKDAQYIMWREVFQRACAEDAAHRTDRVRFFARLLDGLSHTEGSQAGWRSARDLLVEAYQCEPALAVAVAEQMIKAGLAPWTKLLSGALRGIACRRPDLAGVANFVFDRLGLPFMDDETNYPLSHVIGLAPPEDRNSIVQHAVGCLEVDAEVALRFALLKQADVMADRYGAERPTAALDRWRQQGIPDNRSQRDDPYRAVSSLEELKAALASGTDDNNQYWAIRKFEQLAPISYYKEVRAFIDRPDFTEDQTALTAAARAAVAAGNYEDARQFAGKLQTKAETDGSWGHWQSGAKHRLHQVLVELEGDSARAKAFDAFALDLSRGREWTGSLLPDLVDIFELFYPRPSWPALWEVLAAHLSQFRDYKLGGEIEPAAFEGGEEALISDLLFRAIRLFATDLERQVRLAVNEFSEMPGGSKITLTLLDRLFKSGGEYAVVGARIASEQRHCPAVASYLQEWLSQWAASDDIALLNYARVLAHELDRPLERPQRQLPAFYNLIFPEEHIATVFEPPTGFDPANPGLWTDDPFSWTWPLERPLEILARATRFNLTLLRRRAAQLMRNNGGRSDFGPEALDAQQTMMRRLDLRIMHRRLLITAAFRAVRQLAAELLLAGELDPDCMSVLLRASGAPNPFIPTCPPQPRPLSIIRPGISLSFMSNEIQQWLDGVESAPYSPVEPGWKVVASVATFERTSPRRDMTEEHILLPWDVGPSDDLESALYKMPQVSVFRRLFSHYDGYATGGVAVVRPDLAGSLPDRAIVLCPTIAESVGLTPDPTDMLSFVDENGRSAVKSIWWRDGGIHHRDIDTSIRGEGYLIMASEAAFAHLEQHLGATKFMRVWRNAADEENPKKPHVRQACRAVSSSAQH